MTPLDTLRPGAYKLKTWLHNPNGRPREMDWRLKEAWDHGTKFHCFRVYYDGADRMALYHGNQPSRMVHAHLMPDIFNLLLENLEGI